MGNPSEIPKTIQDHLEARGFDFKNAPKIVKRSIFYADAKGKGLSPEKIHELSEKIIEILAKTESSLDTLRSDIVSGKNNEESIYSTAIGEIDSLVLSIRTSINNPEIMEFRKQFIEVAHLDPDPKKNNMIGQVVLAVIDEIPAAVGDLGYDIIKSVDKNGMESLLKEIKDTIFSGETWKGIVQEMGSGLTSLITDWNGGEDMVYRKVRQSFVALGLAFLLKSIVTKFAKKAVKTSVKAGIQATPLPNH